MKIVNAETVLTVHGTAGEIAEVSLHLQLEPENGEVYVKMSDLDDDEIGWIEKKMEIFGIHEMMSIVFIVVKEEEDDFLE